MRRPLPLSCTLLSTFVDLSGRTSFTARPHAAARTEQNFSHPWLALAFLGFWRGPALAFLGFSERRPWLLLAFEIAARDLRAGRTCAPRVTGRDAQIQTAGAACASDARDGTPLEA